MSNHRCHQPKIRRYQSKDHPHPSLRRPPASPQTEGRGCGTTWARAGQGWNTIPRVGTFQHLRDCLESRSLLQPLDLMKETVEWVIC